LPRQFYAFSEQGFCFSLPVKLSIPDDTEALGDFNIQKLFKYVKDIPSWRSFAPIFNANLQMPLKTMIYIGYCS